MLIDFLERGEGRERNIDVKEKHQSVASCMHPDWDQTRNLDMCPDRESKPQPFGLGNDAPTNWATPARAAVSFFRWENWGPGHMVKIMITIIIADTVLKPSLLQFMFPLTDRLSPQIPEWLPTFPSGYHSIITSSQRPDLFSPPQSETAAHLLVANSVTMTLTYFFFLSHEYPSNMSYINLPIMPIGVRQRGPPWDQKPHSSRSLIF